MRQNYSMNGFPPIPPQHRQLSADIQTDISSTFNCRCHTESQRLFIKIVCIFRVLWAPQNGRQIGGLSDFQLKIAPSWG